MDQFVINGGRRLTGSVSVSGAKNAGLPVMAAAALCDDVCIIDNLPYVKDIIISLGATHDIKDMMSNFGEIFQSHSKFGGIMIVLDVSAASRVLTEILNFNNQNYERELANMQNENSNNLIVISINEGYSEDVMHVARKAGATGGTVIKGRLADVEQFAEFMDTKADGEREMLCILAPSKVSKQIMEEVNREFGLTSSANGIIFALPAEKAFKI